MSQGIRPGRKGVNASEEPSIVPTGMTFDEVVELGRRLFHREPTAAELSEMRRIWDSAAQALRN